MEGKLKHIDLQLIRDDIICRVTLDHDRVTEMACLMIDGVEYPPVDVFEDGNGGYIIGDGRTRVAAARELNERTIKCRVHPKAPPAKVLAFAYNANYGGAKPPTQLDARHTILQFIEMKVSYADIEKAMPYPPSVTKRIWRGAKQQITMRKCARAYDAIRANQKLNTEHAADEFGLKVKVLQNYMKNKKGPPTYGRMGDIKKKVKAKHKALTYFQATMLKNVMKEYLDGLMSRAEVNEVLALFDDALTRHQKNYMNWRNRFVRLKP